ncbi:MAG: hypothetical protein AAGI71_04985 [Bacteroidota bacterium]
MMRILLAVLAVVAAVAGYVLQQPFLYVASGLVALGALLSLLADRPSRSVPKPVQPLPEAPPLENLGILEIRPRARTTPSSMATPVQHAAPTARAATPAVKEPREPFSPPSVLPTEASPVTEPTIVPPTDPGADFALVPPAEASAPTDLHLWLRALRQSLNAHAVLLLRYEAAAETYTVVEAASEATLHPEALALPAPDALTDALALPVGHALLRSVPPDAEPPRHYAAPTPIRELALAPVVPGQPAYVLAVDTLDEDGLTRQVAEASLGLLATLLRQLQPAPLAGLAHEVVPPIPPAEAATPEVEASEPAEAEIRPRREIIGEEMAAARDRGASLALALVHLVEAETIAAVEDPALIKGAEDQLRARLDEAVLDGRIERFGELIFGVFLAGPITDVETSIGLLQESLLSSTEAGDPEVAIGIALMQDRHTSADEFRADATEALREAFETGTWTIVE